MSTGGKKRNKRGARKRAIRFKNWVKELFKDEMVKQDSIYASHRNYGEGKSK